MRNYLTLALTLLAFGTATMTTTMAQSSRNPEQRTGTAANNARHGLGAYGGYYNYWRPYHRWHHWRHW
ncbi:MAG TPA: hypothetical protein VGJ20_33025 [Xanthobacteraceae bacterium]|jgi:hypothetical protein